MGALLDSGFRALAYCLMPRVILLSALPLFLLVAGGGLLGWLYWEPGVALVRARGAARSSRSSPRPRRLLVGCAED